MAPKQSKLAKSKEGVVAKIIVEKEEKAAELTRTSSLANIHGTSIARQKAGNKECSKNIDLPIGRCLVLKGVSGTLPLWEREGVPEFFAACHREGIKKVIIQDETRLARRLLVQDG